LEKNGFLQVGQKLQKLVKKIEGILGVKPGILGVKPGILSESLSEGPSKDCCSGLTCDPPKRLTTDSRTQGLQAWYSCAANHISGFVFFNFLIFRKK
jgi:hypothetical protein